MVSWSEAGIWIIGIELTMIVAAMFWISSKLTLVMLCVVPPISIGAVFYGRYLRKLSNLTQEAVGDMSKVRAPSYFERDDMDRVPGRA